MGTKKILNYELEFSNGISLCIYENRAKSYVLITLAILAIAIILTPIIAAIFLIDAGEEIPFGFILTCVVAVLTSGYLAKLYLWNKYGKEVFCLQKNHLSYYCDYHFFKDNKQDIQYQSISVYYIICNRPKKITKKLIKALKPSERSIICFRVDEKFIYSKNEIPLGVIIELAQQLHAL